MKNIIVKLLNKLGYKLIKVESKKTTLSNIIDSKIPNPDSIPVSTTIQYSHITSAVIIGERCLIHKAVLNGNITIGNNTTINGPGTEFYSSINQIKIGNFCSIARHTAIQDHNHDMNCITTYFIKYHIFKENSRNYDLVSKGDVIIGNDVWIGTQSVILTGVTIGDGAIVAANSVVTENVPPYAIVGGTPAKVLKYRFSPDIIEKLLEIKWWDWDLEKIRRNKDLFYGDLTIKKVNSIVD